MKKLILCLLLLWSATAYSQKWYSDSSFMWRRVGLVFKDSALRNFEAPTVKFEGNPQLLTTLTNVWKMWFTWIDNTGTPNIGYAESFDGLSWVRSASVLIANHRSSCIFEFGGTYYCFAASTLNGNQIDKYTSANGFTGWTLATSGVVTKGSAGTWNGSGVFNSWVDTIGSTWYMVVDGQSTLWGFADGVYTSTDGTGTTWTPLSGNPNLPLLTSPFWKKIGANVWAWGGQSGSNAILPTDLVRFFSTNSLVSWTQNPGMSVFHRETTYEGVNNVLGQTQDPVIVQYVPVAGDTLLYMYNIATPNGNASGGGYIELSIYNGSFYNLINGTENASKYFQLESNGLNPYFNKPLGIGTQTPIAMIDVESITAVDSGNATIAATNFIAANSASFVLVAYNMQYSPYIGWNSQNAANVAYGMAVNNTGFTWYYNPAAHSYAAPSNSLATLTFNATISNAVLDIPLGGGINFGNGTPTVGLNMGGDPIVATNITANTINGMYPNLYQGTPAASNIALSQTKQFASGFASTDETFINTQNTSLTGTQNTSIGFGSSNSLAAGAFNVAIGVSALSVNITGNGNTAIGRDALVSATGGNLVGLGQEAGRAFTSASNSTALGWEAGYQNAGGFASANVAYLTVIGALAQGTQANSMILGDVPSGSGFTRVGIATPAPSAWLVVPVGLSSAGFAPFKFTIGSPFGLIATTALAGNGSIMTITYAAQSYVPFVAGNKVFVTGTTSTGASYNGIWTCTAASTTTATLSGTGTGTQSVAGTIQQYTLLDVTAPGAMEQWLDSVYYTGQSSTRYNFAMTNRQNNFSVAQTFQQQVTIGSVSGTTTWNPNNVIPGSFVSVQPGTLNDATTAASGTLSNAYVSGITSPTLTATNASVTYTNAYTFWINAAPVAGTNVAITNSYALGVTGNSLFNGTITSGAVNLTGSADLTGQTSAVTVTSYAVPGSTTFNTFRVGGYITVTAVSLDVIQLQVTWTDETSTSRTQSFFVQGATTGIGATGAFAYSPIDIRVKKGTTITVATILTTGTGSITYDAGANITQLY